MRALRFHISISLVTIAKEIYFENVKIIIFKSMQKSNLKQTLMAAYNIYVIQVLTFIHLHMPSGVG